MARTGTSTIIALARKICKVRAIYGAIDLSTRATPAFAAAVTALEAACQAFDALDDRPGEIDNTAPHRPGEDGPPL